MRAMRSITTFVILFLTMSVTLAGQENNVPPSLPLEEQPSKNKQLMDRMALLLDKIESSYPGFSRYLNQDDDKLLNGFMKSLDERIEIVDKSTAENYSGKVAGTSSFNSLEIPSKSILYCRIDSFNPDSLRQLASDLKHTNAKDNRISSVILDLRGCVSTRSDYAMDALRLLCDNRKLDVQDADKRILKKPFAVLVGASTSGAAECLAYIVKEKAIALLIGSPTAGKPFEYKIVELYDDKVIAVPEIPDFLRKMNSKSIKPDIESKSAQIDYEKLAGNPEMISEDKSASLASDILKSVSIFNQD